jgi:hypothetical protein
MGLSSNQFGCLAVICETRSQTKHITIATHFVFHQFNWVKLDYRKVKFLTIDFTEGVILQPLA